MMQSKPSTKTASTAKTASATTSGKTADAASVSASLRLVHPQQPLPQDAIEVGRVLGSYGLKGAIKVAPLGDATGLLASADWWLQDLRGGLTQLHCKGRKLQGSAVVAQPDGLAVPEHAQLLKGQQVFVSRAAFPQADEGEFYWVDLIGCTALAADGSVLGTVAQVMDNGAHAILQISDGTTEHLIPFVDAFVGEVDLSKRLIHTSWFKEYSE